MITDALIAQLREASEGSERFDREIAAACGIAWSPDEDGNFGCYGILPRRTVYSRTASVALRGAAFSVFGRATRSVPPQAAAVPGGTQA